MDKRANLQKFSIHQNTLVTAVIVPTVKQITNCYVTKKSPSNKYLLMYLIIEQCCIMPGIITGSFIWSLTFTSNWNYNILAEISKCHGVI